MKVMKNKRELHFTSGLFSADLEIKLRKCEKSRWCQIATHPPPPCNQESGSWFPDLDE